MASDIIVASAYGYGGDPVGWSALVAPSSTIVPGTSFDEPWEPEDAPEPAPVRARCPKLAFTGAPCHAYATGDDGLCAGHRRQRLATEAKAAARASG